MREKTINGYTYLYRVESVREDGRTKQRIIKNLGRKHAVLASDGLERLAASVARYAERALLLSQIDGADGVVCGRIGPPLLFGRLWEETGCRAVITALLAGRGFEFAVERAVITAVLHRLLVSGPVVDRLVGPARRGWPTMRSPASTAFSCTTSTALWFYRALAWLGEETGPAVEGALAPRCIKDVIEEQLFERRRDLFSELSVAFMDTTTLSFEGEGGVTLGAHGHSKDHRPHPKQMVLAVVLDGDGRPLSTEMLPGNTADVTMLLPVVDRLRQRFAVGRVCIVADRGMISKVTITALEERSLEYILSAWERSSRVIRTAVLDAAAPFMPLLIHRAGNKRGGGETQLFVKEVRINGARYIVCRNQAEAEKDRADRCRTAGFRPEWGDVLRDLDRVADVEIDQGGKQITLRTPGTGVAGRLFQAARAALPPNVRDDTSAA